MMAHNNRHGGSGEAFRDLVELVDLHLPYNCHVSLYRLLKFFPKSSPIRYFYCKECRKRLNFVDECVMKCSKCDKEYSKTELIHAKKYFLYVPLEGQLIQIVESELSSNIRRECEESDVINSDEYKRKKAAGIIGPNDFTIQWFYDGVQLCENSPLEAYPVMVMVNEFSYRIRKKLMMLCSLWYDKGRPDPKMYLEPFIEELKKLETVGFEYVDFTSKKKIKAKVHSLFCVCDSVARCALQCEHQYNGEYGCPYCYQKGKVIEVGEGHARVYILGQYEMRTMEKHLEHVEEALRSKGKKPVMGVLGRSIVMDLSNINFPFYFPPEYMHAGPLGIVKLFLTAWTNRKYKGRRFHLGSAKIKILAQRLSRIKPPTEITRTPRELNEKWNANDFKNFALYYSLPCLKGLLDSVRYRHWSRFVFGFKTLLQTKISEDERIKAGEALNEFVRQIPELYGEEFCTSNAHLLTHMAGFVKLYGALWAWSAFPFEGFNCILEGMFQGTQYIPENICTSLDRLMYLRTQSHIFADDDCDEKAKRLFAKYMDKNRIRNGIEFGDDLRLFGKPEVVQLTISEIVLIERAIGGEDIEPECESYNRFIYKKILFHSREYQRLTKRFNSIITTVNEDFLVIRNLLRVRVISSQEEEFVIIGQKLALVNNSLCSGRDPQIASLTTIVRESPEEMCCSLESVAEKCVGVPYEEDAYCMIKIVNHLETD